jgi:hypothetical protein
MPEDAPVIQTTLSVKAMGRSSSLQESGMDAAKSLYRPMHPDGKHGSMGRRRLTRLQGHEAPERAELLVPGFVLLLS